MGHVAHRRRPIARLGIRLGVPLIRRLDHRADLDVVPRAGAESVDLAFMSQVAAAEPSTCGVHLRRSVFEGVRDLDHVRQIRLPVLLDGGDRRSDRLHPLRQALGTLSAHFTVGQAVGVAELSVTGVMPPHPGELQSLSSCRGWYRKERRAPRRPSRSFFRVDDVVLHAQRADTSMGRRALAGPSLEPPSALAAVAERAREPSILIEVLRRAFHRIGEAVLARAPLRSQSSTHPAHDSEGVRVRVERPPARRAR